MRRVEETIRIIIRDSLRMKVLMRSHVVGGLQERER